MTDCSDDPRITAYVLGELTGAERAAFEAELAANAELQREVEAVRDTSQLLREGLKAESAKPVLSVRRKAAIEQHLKRRTGSRQRVVFGTAAACAVLVLCALTLWSLRSSHVDEESDRRRSAAALLNRIGEALRQYQADFHALPPDTGFGLSAVDASQGAGKTYDAGSLWRYLSQATTREGKTRGPYINFSGSELASYNDPVSGPSYYVVDSWGTAVGYVGSPIRVIHNRGGFDLFSAGPDRKTGMDATPGAPANLAYDGIDNDGDGVVDNSTELGGAALNGCLTVASAAPGMPSELLDDLNNWDQRN